VTSNILTSAVKSIICRERRVLEDLSIADHFHRWTTSY